MNGSYYKTIQFSEGVFITCQTRNHYQCRPQVIVGSLTTHGSNTLGKLSCCNVFKCSNSLIYTIIVAFDKYNLCFFFFPNTRKLYRYSNDIVVVCIFIFFFKSIYSRKLSITEGRPTDRRGSAERPTTTTTRSSPFLPLGVHSALLPYNNITMIIIY